jgi:uncharacterized membrane protein
MKISFRVVLLLLVSVLSVASVSRAGGYTFLTMNIDFPSIHDDLFGCAATATNDRGVIVGGCNDLHQNSELRGFQFDGRRFSELDFHHTKTAPAASADLQDAELFLLGRSAYQAAPFNGPHAKPLPGVRSRKPVIEAINPQDINNQGHVTGWYFDGSRLRGFIKRNGKVAALDIPNAVDTEAVGINDFDQIVGDYRGTDGLFHGFIYKDGNYASLDFAPGEDTGASGVNNLGQIVGCYSLCSHGFLYNTQTSTFTTIDVPGAVLTQARDINDLGQIVGVYFDGETTHGFVYDKNGFQVIDAPGAVVTSVFGINNAGRISGSYVIEKSGGEFEHHAFLAIP